MWRYSSRWDFPTASETKPAAAAATPNATRVAPEVSPIESTATGAPAAATGENAGGVFGGSGELVQKLRTALDEMRRQSVVTKREKRQRKPIPLEKYDGVTTDWTDFEQQFDIVCRSNQWDPEEQGLYLAASLTGSARTVLKGLTGAECQEFERVYALLRAKFDNQNRMEAWRTEFRNYKRTTDTKLLDYADGIERLLDKGYPRLPEEVRQTMAVDAFLRGLPPGPMRVHTQLQKCPTLRAAADFASHFEQAEAEGGSTKKPVARALTVVDPEEEEAVAASAAPNRVKTPPMTPLPLEARDDTQWERLLSNLVNLSPRARGRARSTEKQGRCYACGAEGHFARDCKAPKKDGQNKPKTPDEPKSGN